MSEPSTDRHRLEQEIARYRDCVDVHDLPAIYHVWSHRWVLPKLQACGYQGVDDFYFQQLKAQSVRGGAEPWEVVSIGAGNCDLEVRLARLLVDAGIENLRFRCLELNPYMIERGRELARGEGLERFFYFDVQDIDDWQPGDRIAACLANHSLHHIVDLEGLFAKVRRAIGPEGVFLTNDMIGRNGHMRWPEALARVEELWRELPQRYKYNHQLQRWDDEFVNWDCSGEGNEGIRAQDILPLLVEDFQFESFIAFANVADIFIDRSYGHNFDPDDPEDVAFIHRVAELDETEIDRGAIKPTHILAAMTTAPVAKPRHYRHWTADFCVRRPDRPPEATEPPEPRSPSDSRPTALSAGSKAERSDDEESEKAEEAALAQEWFYEFELPSGHRTRSYAPPEVRDIHRSREAMLFGDLDLRFENSWQGLRCLDLACHQGYFSTALARRGCRHVLGVDGRERNVENARLISRALALDNVAFTTADLQRIEAAALGTFDVVLLFGILYHLEDLIRVLRLARAVTGGVCMIETQVGPNLSGSMDWGAAGYKKEIMGALCLVDESADAANPNHNEASLTNISVVPSREGLLWLLKAVGFEKAEILEPPSEAYEQLRDGHRVMVRAE